jgi:uncharacterized protein
MAANSALRRGFKMVETKTSFNKTEATTYMAVIKESKRDLRERYGVRRIGIFGSYAKNKQRRKSDIDILVEFEKEIDLFDFLDVKDFLEKILKKKVDLVMKTALKPNIGKRILKEVRYV